MDTNKQQTFWKKLTCTKGGFSPFMFGMLMSVAAYSAIMQKWSLEEVKRSEERQIKMQKERADQVALAVENAILTENVRGENNYNKDVTLDRVQRFMSGTTGFNTAGEAIQLKSAQTDQQFGANNERIIINTTDDSHVRERINRIEGDQGINTFDEVAGTRIIDTNAIRQKQIKQSRQYLEMEASQIYRAYVSYGFKFPSATEYEEAVQAATGLRDSWGQEFKYERKGDKKATISFTTPWGYTVTKQLNME